MIDVSRDDIIVMLEAGYIYLAMKKFKEAQTIFEGVCELAPKNDVPQVAVGNVYFARGKYLEAIRKIKQAIKDNPSSAFAYSHLGEAQFFYGKKEDALKSLEKASELEPTPEGRSGEFARSLIDLINMGYDPEEFRKYAKDFVAEQKKNLAEQEKNKAGEGTKKKTKKSARV